MSAALIAFGGNLGNVLDSFVFARSRLLDIGKVTASSALYQTVPVGGPTGQPDYFNASVSLETDANPRGILNHLLAIELERGRVRDVRWGPRTLDLDLLAVDDQIVNEPGLVVPHPEMGARAFVLIPLEDVAPDWKHPIDGWTVNKRAALLDATGIVQTSHSW